ncbi:MAG: ABC transporter permease [Bacteroidales bacterium]|nr:ABC transporter permease [Bacteroidales bacterium]
MKKLEFIIRRLGLALITLLLITFVVFVVIQIPPGDYVDTLVTKMISEGEIVTQANIDALKEMYGMNRPFLSQYLSWLGGIVTGDWGTSFYYNQNVLVKVSETLGNTLLLSLSTMIFTYLLSLPIAIYSAKHQYTPGDYLFTFIGFVGLAVPNFLFAVLLMFLSYKWTGKAIMGFPDMPVTSIATFIEWVKSLIIPIVVIGTGGTCSLIRTIRAQMLDEQQQPYVLSIRAKGVSESMLTYKYELRAVLNPIVSGLGGMLSGIFNGSTITAIVLMLPTLGPVLLKALQTQDIYLSGGILLISAALVVIGNLISDLLLAALDPRIEILEGGRKNAS